MTCSEAHVLVIGEGSNHQAVQLPALLQQWAQLLQVLTSVFQQTLSLFCAQLQRILQRSHIHEQLHFNSRKKSKELPDMKWNVCAVAAALELLSSCAACL